MNTAVLLLALSLHGAGPDIQVEDPQVHKALQSPQIEWYDIVQVYQRESLVLRHTANGLTNVNNHEPWAKPGGTDNVEGLTSKRFRYSPPDTKIIYWTREGGQIAWMYPVGTMFGEVLYHEGKLFELRVRTREKNDWKSQLFRVEAGKFIQDAPGKLPPGYVGLDSCEECHEDTSRKASELDAAWSGSVRGSDGIFSFHFLEAPKEGFAVAPHIEERYESIIRPRKKDEKVLKNTIDWLIY